jgi:hypothetical protein
MIKLSLSVIKHRIVKTNSEVYPVYPYIEVFLILELDGSRCQYREDIASNDSMMNTEHSHIFYIL